MSNLYKVFPKLKVDIKPQVSDFYSLEMTATELDQLRILLNRATSEFTTFKDSKYLEIAIRLSDLINEKLVENGD